MHLNISYFDNVYMYIKYQMLCNTEDKKILHDDWNKLKSEL